MGTSDTKPRVRSDAADSIGSTPEHAPLTTPAAGGTTSLAGTAMNSLSATVVCALAAVLVAVVLGAMVSPGLLAEANNDHEIMMAAPHYHTETADDYVQMDVVSAAERSTTSFSSAAGTTQRKAKKATAMPQARMAAHERAPMMMTDEGMPEILEMEMGEKYSDFGADTSASNGDSSGGDGAGTGGGGGSADKEDSSRRMLIRRGQLELQLERPPLRRQGQDPAAEEAQQKAEAETAAAIMNSARQAVIEIFEASGGYIETYSKQDGDNMHHHHHHHHHYHHASHGRKQGDRLEFTARVPSDRFDSVMVSLRDLVLAPQQLVEGPAGSVLSESVSTEDVTGQYTDAEVRPPGHTKTTNTLYVANRRHLHERFVSALYFRKC
jgi:hypothetical protein